MKENFDEIISNFQVDKRHWIAVPLGSGLINDTYCVKSALSDQPKYLLQRVNSQIFKDVPLLMRNIVHVTSHIKNKLSLSSATHPGQKVLEVVPALTGEMFYLDARGNYWRVFCFIENSRSFDRVETEQHAFQGGLAFGQFHAMLSDLNITSIADSIPDFHNISARLDALQASIHKDPFSRVAALGYELAFISEREDQMKKILRLGSEERIPRRVIHSDTKFNNILFDNNGNVQCVVDLDTVMVGYLAYDFGDAIRTIVNSAAEDENELQKIVLNIPLFEAFTRGYLSESMSFLEEEELGSLIEGVLLLPYMQAVRFLTDYIDGDVYYKTAFPGHNLQRTMAQLQLVRKLEENRDRLAGLIEAEAERLINSKYV
ncbi:phosphotransferase enzyme family protein [Arcticibacter sp.]|uniref:phosphotransferase enzyme family protein n=1 Tax=Arcticibacter sp. TaxID=1872630 RepID=UPI003890EAEB